MGKKSRKTKAKQADFTKTKLKVGRRLPKTCGSNSLPNLVSASVQIPAQSLISSDIPSSNVPQDGTGTVFRNELRFKVGQKLDLKSFAELSVTHVNDFLDAVSHLNDENATSRRSAFRYIDEMMSVSKIPTICISKLALQLCVCLQRSASAILKDSLSFLSQHVSTFSNGFTPSSVTEDLVHGISHHIVDQIVSMQAGFAIRNFASLHSEDTQSLSTGFRLLASILPVCFFDCPDRKYVPFDAGFSCSYGNRVPNFCAVFQSRLKVDSHNELQILSAMLVLIRKSLPLLRDLAKGQWCSDILLFSSMLQFTSCLFCCVKYSRVWYFDFDKDEWRAVAKSLASTMSSLSWESSETQLKPETQLCRESIETLLMRLSVCGLLP